MGKYFLMSGSYDSTMSFWGLDLDKLPNDRS